MYVLWLAGSGKKLFEKLRNRMKRKGRGMRDEKGKGEVENITRVQFSIAIRSRMMAALQR